MGLPPVRTKAMSVICNPKPRWRLSQFFAGALVKTEKSGTVPAAHVFTCRKYRFRYKHYSEPFRNTRREQSHFFYILLEKM
ncbi:MAG: hypothetical protein BWX80_01021 [Candidatus Hydrogenedentes bacterium ADurb.Bin101]|jgi:hypothetical protein|nr:MAG: hypothetical protein BWX80_01021 [Candidatus Hydrogenedentes bacterium ADurb.Bin101]